MPRKPSSVFVFAEIPGSTSLQGWRVPLGDNDATLEQIASVYHTQVPLGSRLYAVEDTKVEAFDVSPSVTAVDDPRLGQGE